MTETATGFKKEIKLAGPFTTGLLEPENQLVTKRTLNTRAVKHVNK